jgi:phage FluMu protein Com
MEQRDRIICIFCGRIAKIKNQGELKIVVCPKCKRETELDEYQAIFDKWMGDIRKEEQ